MGAGGFGRMGLLEGQGGNSAVERSSLLVRLRRRSRIPRFARPALLRPNVRTDRRRRDRMVGCSCDCRIGWLAGP